MTPDTYLPEVVPDAAPPGLEEFFGCPLSHGFAMG